MSKTLPREENQEEKSVIWGIPDHEVNRSSICWGFGLTGLFV